MAGVLVDVLLERLAALALDKIEQEMKLVVGVKQEIKNLTEKLEAIHAVLEDAEQRQEMDTSVKLWLNKLNDVSFDMDDVLDEWITKVLRRQLEKQEKQSSKALSNKKKSLEEIDVRRLINLRHLHLRGCSVRLIKGIEKLRDLQTLDVFRVGAVEGNKLEDLKDLNQLQGSLEIEITGNPKMAENAAILVNKPHLLELNLLFPLGGNLDPGLGREIMNGLEPHPGLESLTIWRYKAEAFSPWLSSLHSLRVLSLEVCDCQVLPSLGKLASLESLTIRGLHGVEKVGVEFLGIELGKTSSSSIFISFPKLKKLTIESMWSWEEWEGVEEENSEKITIMPCLSELTVYGCQELKALPDFLWKTPLQKLRISSSPILENLYREETGEQWAKISHIPNTKVG